VCQLSFDQPSEAPEPAVSGIMALTFPMH
jgi:hypothetical protein